jgi:hypothetical protein
VFYSIDWRRISSTATGEISSQKDGTTPRFVRDDECVNEVFCTKSRDDIEISDKKEWGYRLESKTISVFRENRTTKARKPF